MIQLIFGFGNKFVFMLIGLASPDASSEPLDGCFNISCVIDTDGHTCIYLYLLAFKLSMLSAGSTCIS